MKKSKLERVSMCFSLGSKKRGQLTIFIILAIIIVSLILIYFFVTNQTEQTYSNQFLTGKSLSAKTEVVRENIYDCINSVTREAIIMVSFQGGHHARPEKYFDSEESFFSYYYYQGEFLMPTQTEIEQSISNYIDKNLLECISNKEISQTITLTTPKTKTQIKEKEVTFTIDTILTIIENKSTKLVRIKEKTFSQNSLLKGMIEIAEYLTEYHKEDPKYYCVNCLGLMAHERNLNVEILPFLENNTYQIVIHENQTLSPQISMFIYLNKYTGEEVSPIYD